MTRFSILAVLVAMPAGAADLPDRACAPAVQDRPPICTGAAAPVERPIYVGPSASLPADEGLRRLSAADQAACRAEGDVVFRNSAWADAAVRAGRRDYAIARCAERILQTTRRAGH